MIWKVTLNRTSDSVSLSLPSEMVERLNLGGRDEITAIETEGGVLLTTHDDEIVQSLRLYERARQKYDKAFERLAE